MSEFQKVKRLDTMFTRTIRKTDQSILVAFPLSGMGPIGYANKSTRKVNLEQMASDFLALSASKASMPERPRDLSTNSEDCSFSLR